MARHLVSLALLATSLFTSRGLTAPSCPTLRDIQNNIELAGSSPPSDNLTALFGRQASIEQPGDGALLCPTGECPDGSCCGGSGICGYGPDFCSKEAKCQSNCNALAMCGPYSEGGNTACGLGLCCSWGGWCGTSQTHCVGPNQWALCQPGYGKCEVIRPKEYGYDSGSTNGRTIGYYQSWNTRNRLCNKVWPSQIKKEQYTHLYFAFATIDPKSFKMAAAHEADVPLMKDFTALKGPKLQTWIAVGGFDFSDNNTVTHTTWSDLCSTQANRAAFITSAKTYMDTYGFQGIDLDWEYPGAKERGGKRADVVNFVSLLREMRAALGTSYGISLTLAPDYWYLRYFDVAGLAPYVDHMGFMAYDLHGSWDADVRTLGSIVRGQADVREIYNNTIPLAYAGVDFKKITFGVAWYGRGYTVADPNCNTFGCPFVKASKPAKCTNSDGVMSLDEVRDLIQEKNLRPRLHMGAMMKELTWDDQWIGYDDEETIAMKKQFANNLGFGGTMAWSVDFNSQMSESAPLSTDGSCGPANGGTVCEGTPFGDCCSANGWCGSSEAHCGSGCLSGKCIEGSVTTDGKCGAQNHNSICGDWPAGDCCSPSGWCGSTDQHCGDGCQSGSCKAGGNVVFLDPKVYQSRTAKCAPPCTFVLPPISLASKTTISVPPYTTSLEVGSSAGGVFVVTTTTITVVVAPIATDQLPQSNVIVTRGQTGQAFQPSPSLLIPESTVTVTNGAGAKTGRVIHFPPWPDVTAGPPDRWSSKLPVWVSSNGSSSTVSTATGSNMTYTDPPYKMTPIILPCAAQSSITQYIPEYKAVITVGTCAGEGYTSMDRNCAPTTTVKIEEDASVRFSLGCTLFTGTGVRATTTGPLPTYTKWPEGELVWDEDDEDEDDDDGNKKSSCNLWFFNICLKWGNTKIGGFFWKFPPGIYPPIIRPPPIKWPVGVTVTGNLPGPWPPVTIGWDKKLTYPAPKPGQCTTRTADLCSTTTTLDIKTTKGTKTTSTRTQSTCTKILGCKVEDDDWETTTTVSCPTSRSTIIKSWTPTGTLAARAEVTLTTAETLTGTRTETLHARQTAACPPVVVSVADYILLPSNPEDVEDIIFLLDLFPLVPGDRSPGSRSLWDNAKQFHANDVFTAFFFLKSIPTTYYDTLMRDKDDNGIYDLWNIEEWMSTNPFPNIQPLARRNLVNETRARDATLGARDIEVSPWQEPWELSILSVPPTRNWRQDTYYQQGNPPQFRYKADDSYGRGQIIYLVDEKVDERHAEFTSRFARGRPAIRVLTQDQTFGVEYQGTPDPAHGTAMAALLVGETLGLARNAQLVLATAPPIPTARKRFTGTEILISLLLILEDMLTNNQGSRDKVVINMSLAWVPTIDRAYRSSLFRIVHALLKRLDQEGAVIVVATHNEFFDRRVPHPDELDIIATWADPSASPGIYIPNLIIATGMDQNSVISPRNPYRSFMAVAPGYDVSIPSVANLDRFGKANGASVAAPRIAATIAYWRGLPHTDVVTVADLRSPSNIKKLVQFMHRRLSFCPFVVERTNPWGQASEPTDPAGQAYYPGRPWGVALPFLWTGEVDGGNCLMKPTLAGCPTALQSTRLGSLQARGADLGPYFGNGNYLIPKRQAAGAPLVLGPPTCHFNFTKPGDTPGSGSGSGPDGGNGGGGLITYSIGAPAPTCAAGAGCGGQICSGFFCVANPTGKHSDFWDPKDPKHTTSRPPASPSGGGGNGNGSGGGGNTGSPTKGVTSPVGGGGSSGANPTPNPGTTPVTKLPEDLPTLTGCPRPLSTATVCFGVGGRQNCATSLVCPEPTPTPKPVEPNNYKGDLLAIVVTQSQTLQYRWGCQDNARLFEIFRFEKHAEEVGSKCFGFEGESVASSNMNNGKEMVGCDQGYTNGYSVCTRNDGNGVNIHKPNGDWTKCEPDDATLINCSLSCERTMTRKMKCDGIWWKYKAD